MVYVPPAKSKLSLLVSRDYAVKMISASGETALFMAPVRLYAG